MANLPSMWIKNFDLLESSEVGLCAGVLSEDFLFDLLEDSEKLIEWT